jgi:IS30 family transposase
MIMHGHEQGLSMRAIASMLNRAPSTISRELNRNKERWCYEAHKAQRWAHERRHMPRVPRKLSCVPMLLNYVLRGIKRCWSPQQICGRLLLDHPNNEEMRISHETIYAFIYAMPRGELRKELVAQLRRKHTNRRKQSRGANPNRGRIADMVSIHDRPEEIEGRKVPGHCEGDLIIGKSHGSAVGTLVERTSRYLVLAHLKQHTAEKTRLSFTRNLEDVPKPLLKSLTYDQGKEMSQHKILAEELDIGVYFCDPHSPWQRGTNENTNGLVRQYLPKGTDLSHRSQEDLDEIALSINTRPRKILGFKTPQEVYFELLDSYTQPNGVALGT